MSGRGGVPVDRGYAWVIVAGAFFNLVVILGVAKSMGIIFVALREHYARSATATSVFYPLMAGCSLLMAPVVTALTEVFTVRSVCLTGSCLVTLGLCIGFAGRSLEAIILPYGIIGGLGVGMVLNPVEIEAPLIISRYFHKRKALAMGILFAGTGVGGIIGPFVITAFLENFGLHGSILLIGALSFNTAIGASLFRPPSYWRHHRTEASSHPVDGSSLPATNLPLVETAEGEVEEDGEEEEEEEEEEVEASALHVSCLSLSNLDLPTTVVLDGKSGLASIAERPERWSLIKRLLHRRTETGELVPIFNASVLSCPVFLMFSAGCLCGMSGFYWNMLTPAYCEEDLGMPAVETARLLSIMGIGDLCGRLLMAATGDKLLHKSRPLVVGLALIGISFSVLLCPFFPSFWAQATSLLCGQLCFGCFVALSPVALGDLVPADALSSAWGFLLFFEGIGHIFTPLLIGAIKDAKGTYFGGYFLVSGFCLLGGLLVTASAVLHKLYKPKSHS